MRLALVARTGKKLRSVAAECEKLGATAEVFPCDVADEAAVAALAAAVTQRFGAVDVLINNAGKFAGAPFTEMTVADFDGLIAANLRSVFLVSRAFVPGMLLSAAVVCRPVASTMVNVSGFTQLPLVRTRK